MEGPHLDRKANVCMLGNKEEYIELLLLSVGCSRHEADIRNL